ncbi:hypothetical protein H3V53_06390 [Paraburkholderia bengalensis]|uniref:Uncharacterized protein n=1 Tax=Paraburkholderia bengalensis TaxID=2747562 RepID=A0ABU8IML9_9BURK
MSVGDVPNTSDPVPVSSEITPSNCAEVVAANCDSAPLVNAMAEAHVKPELVVQRSALFAPEQLGIANAVGDAVEPVALAITVFPACGARDVAVTLPHAGAVVGPVDTIA